MILDGLRGRELARLEKEVAEYSEKFTGLEDRPMNLYAKLKTKKSYNAQDVFECLVNIKSKSRTFDAKDAILTTHQFHSEKKELMLYDRIEWIKGLIDKLRYF